MDSENGSTMWKALADPKRRRIVQLLQAQPLTTGDLCQHFDVSRYAVMKHLKVLEEAGMVMTERRGRQRWNFLNVLPPADTSLNDVVVTPPIPFPNSTPAWLSEETPLVEAQENGHRLALVEPSYCVETNRDLLTRLSYTLTLEAETTAVFATLTQQLDRWWPIRQRDNSVVRLEGHPGGRLYEQFPAPPYLHGTGQQNGLLYGLVTLWHAPYAFKIQGSFGFDDVQATLHLQLQPEADGLQTQLRLTQQFWLPPTQISLAIFEQGWAEMLEAILSDALPEKS